MTAVSAYQPSAAEKHAYEELNRLVHDNYASSAPELARIASDPRQFLNEFRTEFAARKSRGEEPLELDFSTYGLPVCRDLIRSLDEERVILEHDLAILRTRPFGLAIKRMIVEHELGLELISLLRAELDERTNGREGRPPGITYFRLMCLAHCVSRAVGHFDHRKLSMIERAVLLSDRMQQGFEWTSIAEEKRRYENDDFALFQKKTIVPAFEKHRQRMESAFLNGDVIGLPTCAALSEDILLRFLPYELYLGGISSQVLGTDGYSRTSGDLSLHDVQHSTLIYGARQEYEAAHDMGPTERDALRWSMDRWGKDLLEAVWELERHDAEDARAVRFYIFNHHHDQGVPLVPSSIQYDEMEPLGYLLYFKMTWTRQMPRLKEAKRRFRRAHAFLREFWEARRYEEERLWGPKAQHQPWKTNGVYRTLARIAKATM